LNMRLSTRFYLIAFSFKPIYPSAYVSLEVFTTASHTGLTDGLAGQAAHTQPALLRAEHR